jgi:ketohexokinase
MEYVALVGACYIDTILESVSLSSQTLLLEPPSNPSIIHRTPHFPEEDSKLRATSFVRRRGGNTPNSAEILSQYATRDAFKETDGVKPFLWKPLLISALPEAGCPDNESIRTSLGDGVVLDCCLERKGRTMAPASYIIRSQETGSRTIVNYSEVEEMSLDEFKGVWEAVGWNVRWWHFEVCFEDDS